MMKNKIFVFAKVVKSYTIVLFFFQFLICFFKKGYKSFPFLKWLY